MTYCLAIKVNKGLVFASDSCTHEGVDYVTTYCKMHTFTWPGERIIAILTAGNLATSHTVINRISMHLEDPNEEKDLLKMQHMFEVADYVGILNQSEQQQHAGARRIPGVKTEASFIVGGQIHGRAADTYLVYPHGSYISASPETPYLQIGE